jgi:hypothetical protein
MLNNLYTRKCKYTIYESHIVYDMVDYMIYLLAGYFFIVADGVDW